MIRGWPHHIVKIVELVEKHQPVRCVEIGTYAGASAVAIAQVIRQWKGRLTCVDPFAQEPGLLRELADNLANANVAETVSIVCATSVAVAGHWTDELDFLYIDGDHSYEGVWADLMSWWLHLKPGALICGDDYDDPLSPGVAKAWDKFEKSYGQHFEHFATPNTQPPGMKLVWGVKQ